MATANWDPTTLEMGRAFAVIVRYRVGQQFMRAVASGTTTTRQCRNRDDPLPL